MIAVTQTKRRSSLGQFVRGVRKKRGLQSQELATQARMRKAQLTAVENSPTVEVRWFEQIATALGYRNALEMFMSGGDDQFRKLVRIWRSLDDVPEGRNSLLKIGKQIADGNGE